MLFGRRVKEDELASIPDARVVAGASPTDVPGMADHASGKSSGNSASATSHKFVLARRRPGATSFVLRRALWQRSLAARGVPAFCGKRNGLSTKSAERLSPCRGRGARSRRHLSTATPDSTAACDHLVRPVGPAGKNPVPLGSAGSAESPGRWVPRVLAPRAGIGPQVPVGAMLAVVDFGKLRPLVNDLAFRP